MSIATYSRRKRILKRILLSQLRVRFLVGLCSLLLGYFLLITAFFWVWKRQGDAHAEVFGILLNFSGSIVTAAVTLVYLHVSRRSLATAEAATELQREEWRMRMTVKPRFWLVPQPNGKPVSITYRRDEPDGYRKDSPRVHYHYDTLTWPEYVVDVWNDGERSMRLSSYKLWVKDEENISTSGELVGFVVPPNELRVFPVTKEIVSLLFRRREFEQRYERTPCAETVLGLRLYYSDWRDDDHASHDMFYLILTPPFVKEITVTAMDRRR